MKIHYLVAAMLLLCLFANAQTGSIPYQAVARDSFNTPLPDKTISLRFSIKEGTSGGTVLYKETTTTTTNKLGLFTVYIGEGTPVTGTLSAVNWSSGPKYLQVESDPNGGTSYVDMGTSQLKSVPFSLRAESAGNIVGVPSKRVPYSSNSGLLISDPYFVRDSAAGNTSIGVLRGDSYYGLMLGDSNIINVGGSNVYVPSAALHYNDTAQTYSMSMGVGKIPAYGINQLGFLNLTMASGHFAGLSFLEQSGQPQLILGASKYGSVFNIGSNLHMYSTNIFMGWRHVNKSVHGIDADSLSLKIYSSTDSSQRYWTWPNTEGTSGQALVTDGSGNLTFASIGGNVTAMGQHAVNTGNGLSNDTITITKNLNNIYDPSGAVANLLIQLPSSPSEGDVFILTFERAVTTITYTGGSVANGALGTATSGSQKIYTYNAATSKWY